MFKIINGKNRTGWKKQDILSWPQRNSAETSHPKEGGPQKDSMTAQGRCPEKLVSGLARNTARGLPP